jgi:hypothetical protein
MEHCCSFEQLQIGESARLTQPRRWWSAHAQINRFGSWQIPSKVCQTMALCPATEADGNSNRFVKRIFMSGQRPGFGRLELGDAAVSGLAELAVGRDGPARSSFIRPSMNRTRHLRTVSLASSRASARPGVARELGTRHASFE